MRACWGVVTGPGPGRLFGSMHVVQWQSNVWQSEVWSSWLFMHRVAEGQLLAQYRGR
jgi:hypothetical protein